MPLPRWPGRTRMRHTDQTGSWSMCGIFVDRAKGSSAPGSHDGPPDDLVVAVAVLKLGR